MRRRRTDSDPAKAQAEIEKAAKATFERLESDRTNASLQTRNLLAHIREKLFEPNQNADELLKTCGHQGSASMALFHADTGTGIWDYVCGCRLETALRLVRSSNLQFGDIAFQLGYSDYSSFSDAFHAFTGLRPKAFREKSALTSGTAGGNQDELQSVDYWHGLLDDRLEPQQWKELIARFESVYGQSGEDERRTDDSVPAEASLLRRLWHRLGNMASEDQRDLVRGIRFGSPVLFDFLSAKIIPESRKDRQRGIEAAELALESLNAVNTAIGEDLLPNLQALGEARLANALRLALRWDESEQAFGRAEKHWERAGESSEPRVSAEIWRLKASLRQNQRRFSETLSLIDRAIALSRLASDRHSEVRALVQRAIVLAYAGDPKAALLPLREAEELVDEHDPSDLQLSVYQALGTAAILAGDAEEATGALARAKKLCDPVDNEIHWNQIRWVEGLLRQSQDRIQEAETLFQEALTKFIALGERDLAAMLSLELAILHLRQGRTSEAIRLASATIPVFQSLRIHREALAALNLLREAITANELTLDGLATLQSHIARLFPDSLTALWIAARTH